MATTDRGEFLKLVGKYLDGTASVEEIAVLDAYYEIFAEAPDALEGLNEKNLKALEIKMKSGVSRRIKSKEVGKVLPIAAVTGDTVTEGAVTAGVVGEGTEREDAITEWPVVPFYRRWKYASIAAVLALAVSVFYYSSKLQDSGIKADGIAGVNDVAPGKNGATLTMANGEVIELSDAKKGVVIGGKELKYDDGSVVDGSAEGSRTGGVDQQGSGSGPGAAGGTEQQTAGSSSQHQDDDRLKRMMLTASTARGQTYQFVLPDGTKVWLNADSKISFPRQFIGRERKVLLSGEGYFEVVHDAAQPFRVESKGQTVEDIGTAFNISAYADDHVSTTTLVEGSARVSAFDVVIGRKSAVLNVDPQEAISWKLGFFVYKETPLEVVMRQVARWYNVEVVYEKQSLRGIQLGGSVSRYDNVSRILKSFENTGAVKFELNGRTITVKE